MGVYKINSYRGALSDYEDKGIAGSFKFGTDIDVRKEKDTLSATQALVDETGVTFTDLVRFIVEASDGNSYGFGKAGKIYKRTSGGTWSLVYTDSDGEIKGAEEWFHRNGKAYLYWATATKLKRKELPGETDWSDVNDGGLNTKSLDLELSSSQYAQNTDPVGLLIKGNITIEFWINLESLGANAAITSYALQGETEAVNILWGIVILSTGNLQFQHEYDAGSNENLDTVASYISTGTWFHVVIVRDSVNKNILFYVDGVFKETVAYTNQATGGTDNDLFIGASTTGSISIDGLLDEVRVWDVIRTAKQINDNYRQELTGSEAGLVGYWDLNDNYTDKSKNSNDLTAVNAPVFSATVPFVGSANWPKINLTSTNWHTMAKVSGDLLIANDSKIALVGYDESYSDNVLDLIPGHIAKTITERVARASIGTHHPSTPNKGVNGVIDAEVPLAQIGDDGQIFYGDLASPIPLKRMPGGGRVNPGGVDKDIQESAAFFEWQHSFSSDPDVNSWINKKEITGIAYFGVFNADSGKGGIYSYGRKNKNHPFVLNLEYLFDADEIGAVKVINGTLVFGYELDGSFGVKKVDPTKKAIFVYEGTDFKAPTKVPAAITQWKTAKVFTKLLPTGTTVEFWYRVNKTGNFVQAKMEDGTVRFAADDQHEAVFNLGVAGDIFEPRVVGNPNGNTCPDVIEVEVLFS